MPCAAPISKSKSVRRISSIRRENGSVPEFRLVARTGMGLTEPLAESWDGFSLEEETVAAFWWISVAPAEAANLAAACTKAFGCGLPGNRMFVEGGSGEAPAQIFAVGDRQYAILPGAAALPDAIAKVAAFTDQSDGWIAFRFSGEKTRDVMERLCGLDLHAQSFPTGACARAPIEGMAAIIACLAAAEPRLLVLTQRSSARSFVEHVRHAAASACGGH
jgi:sarcosine oxidase subunit gamma